MTSLQIFSGLAPVALGIVGLVMAHSDLNRVRRRKVRKLLPVVEGPDKKLHLWSRAVSKTNVLVAYAAIVFFGLSVCLLLITLNEPSPFAQTHDNMILKSFTDRLKHLGIGGPS